jgi:hypothetical protein
MSIEKITQKLKTLPAQSVVDGGLGLSASQAELSNDLLNIRSRITNFGRGQVTEELKRQMT